MKCVICNKEATENSIVCSDKCQAVRLEMFRLINKYFPTHGCDNCWGDLHEGCTDQCIREFKEGGAFSGDLWGLVHLVTNKKRK